LDQKQWLLTSWTGQENAILPDLQVLSKNQTYDHKRGKGKV
jgi:hypothetical protein